MLDVCASSIDEGKVGVITTGVEDVKSSNGTLAEEVVLNCDGASDGSCSIVELGSVITFVLMRLEVGGISPLLLLGSKGGDVVVTEDEAGMGANVAVDSRLVIVDGV